MKAKYRSIWTGRKARASTSVTIAPEALQVAGVVTKRVRTLVCDFHVHEPLLDRLFHDRTALGCVER